MLTDQSSKLDGDDDDVPGLNHLLGKF